MNRKLSLFEAVLPLVAMLAGFLAGGIFLDFGTELLVVVMLAAATVAGLLAVKTGAGWHEIQKVTGDKIAAVLPAILILLAIGMLIGSWVLSGTIPTLIYYGIKWVNPQYMVLTAFLATATMSLCTGTSWGSAGTIGIAMMGMAGAVGAPLHITAGAVVSGAYFGDKLSPLSDSTNICAIGANADLYAHIRQMFYTAVPSFLLALVVYVNVGSGASGGDRLPASAVQLLRDIETVYATGWWPLLPLLVVLFGIVKKYPAAVVMAVSSLVAMVLGVLVQGFGVQAALIAPVNGFDTAMTAHLGLDPTAFGESFATLLNRGGLYSMVDTLLVIICAFLLAAGLEVSGALGLILETMLKAARSTFGLIAATMASGGVMISLTSHGGVTALIVGGLFQEAFKEKGFAPENLSRSMEDSVTIVEPLLPWTVSAIFMATTLGVPTASYAPWAVFCFCGPIFSLLIAATYDRTRFGLKRLPNEESN